MIADTTNFGQMTKGFKWIDNYTIRFVDPEGTEAIIALNENCKIKSSC